MIEAGVHTYHVISSTGLDPLQYNPYTEPLWRAAVVQYDKGMVPVEAIIAGKLRTKFHQLEAQPHQVCIPQALHASVVGFLYLWLMHSHFSVVTRISALQGTSQKTNY